MGCLALLPTAAGRAAELYRESLARAWHRRLKPLVTLGLGGFACVAGAQEKAERAAQLWGAAEALHEAMVTPTDITDWLAVANTRISAVR